MNNNDLDYRLLDQILDQLDPVQGKVSREAMDKVDIETGVEFHSTLLSAYRRTNWHLVDMGCDNPRLCTNCWDISCQHISQSYSTGLDYPTSVVEIWTSKDLAEFGHTVSLSSLDFGLLN